MVILPLIFLFQLSDGTLQLSDVNYQFWENFKGESDTLTRTANLLHLLGSISVRARKKWLLLIERMVKTAKMVERQVLVHICAKVLPQSKVSKYISSVLLKSCLFLRTSVGLVLRRQRWHPCPARSKCRKSLLFSQEERKMSQENGKASPGCNRG